MIYVTTPIYYVNDDPHIGHVYTTVSADVLARFHRLSGRPAFLLTGTDEHALKVVEAARQRNLSPAQWAESKAAVFARAFQHFNVHPTDFIRTSESRHIEQVSACVQALKDSGDLYLGQYEGWYDLGQEEYVPEVKARQYDFCSPINRKPLVRREEPCWFFRLSAYTESLLDLIEGDTLQVRPAARRPELLARLRDGLHDVPCSRPRTTDWGVAVPGDPEQTVYVWIDALLNYLTAVNTETRRICWPPTVQLVGKDILWFHAVIWPALLLALRKTPTFADLALPRTIRAHSFWVRDGEKMSKSLGNFVTLDHLLALRDHYGADAIRYFLVTAGPNDAADADFSLDRLHETYTAALANTVGNCCARVLAMVNRYCDGVVQPRSANHLVDSDFPVAAVAEQIRIARAAAEGGDGDALARGALAIFRIVDTFIHDTAPFKLAKDPARKTEVAAILRDALEAIRLGSMLLWPIMPERIERLWKALGLDTAMVSLIAGPAAHDTRHFEWGDTLAGHAVGTLAPLFPRLERPFDGTDTAAPAPRQG